MLSMSLVVAVATLMVAKNDKGKRVGKWKGPLIGVMKTFMRPVYTKHVQQALSGDTSLLLYRYAAPIRLT